MTDSQRTPTHLGRQRRAILRVTNRCNRGCRYCIDGLSLEPLTDMSTDTLHRMLDRCEGAIHRELLITGGEPLCHAGLADVLSVVQKHGYSFSIFTNGDLLNDRMLCALADLGCSSIRIGLHDFTEVCRHRIAACTTKLISLAARIDTYGIPIGVVWSPARTATWASPQVIDIVNRLRLGLKIQPLCSVAKNEGAESYGSSDWDNLASALKHAWYADPDRCSSGRRQPYTDFGSVAGLLHLYRQYFETGRIPAACQGLATLVVRPDGRISPCIYRMDLSIPAGVVLRHRARFATEWDSLGPAQCFAERCLTNMRQGSGG